MVFLIEGITHSTAPIPAWCLGRVTLNSIDLNLMLRLEITFNTVLIKFLPGLTILNPESIQMMRGVTLSATVLL